VSEALRKVGAITKLNPKGVSVEVARHAIVIERHLDDASVGALDVKPGHGSEVAHYVGARAEPLGDELDEGKSCEQRVFLRGHLSPTP
jgi:hypothetical protein